MTKKIQSITDLLDGLNEQELRRLLLEQMTKQKLGLVWERNAIDDDRALNNDVVLPSLRRDLSCNEKNGEAFRNLVIEGDNYDSLRLLKSTHANKIRVIYIDPPYNTGNRDWLYNDRYVNENNRWRHSQWLEFLYRRLTLARSLLAPDGVILVSIDDENRARLDMLMEDVFPGRRVGSFVSRVRSGGNDTKGALLSINHEHVLVYANEGFEFKGDGRDEGAYSNADDDPRGDWANDNLVKAHTALQRPEAYYHIQNPATGVWYLGDPDSVWRFSSTTRPLKKKLQADPIEVIVAEKRILWPANEETVIYSSVSAIQAAIKTGRAPKQMKIYGQLKELQKKAETDDKAARLLSYIEPLEEWVGRTIGFGKPRYKRFRNRLKRDVTPVSSWLNPAADGVFDDESDEEVTLTVGATGEGTSLYKRILGGKDFPYPKPLSLLTGLLDQASKKDDIILDFFAGSGTTAHAVLALNALDQGTRRFIMCSNTEASPTDPNKNICRDVCAARLRKIIEGYGNQSPLDSNFGYLELRRVDPADVRLDATPEEAHQLLSMRYSGSGCPPSAEPMKVVYSDLELAVVLMSSVSEKAIKDLLSLSQPRLAVYSSRPQTVAERLEQSGRVGNSYSIGDALLLGQAAQNEAIR
jgi:adenine-specific DNA-methyltransferase